jgi:hypothetical protein
MNLSALHRRLLQDVLEIGNAFPFIITGGYAVQAHGLVDRLSRDIDVATNSPVPMSSLADLLVAALGILSGSPPRSRIGGPRILAQLLLRSSWNAKAIA